MFSMVHSAVLGAATLAVMGSVVSATTVTFQNNTPNPFGPGDYYGTQDATIYPDNLSQYNYGVSPVIFSNGSTQTNSHILLRFDVSSLAGKGAIDSAILKLTMITADDGINPKDIPFSIYRIADANAGWVQGAKYYGAQADNGEVCWDYKIYNTDPGSAVAWAGSPGLSTPVTDYDPTPVATGIYSQDTADNHTTINLALPASLVQDWVDGTNAGLLIVGDITNRAIQFQSSDYGSNSEHPALEVTYAVPEPMSGMMLLIGGGLLMLRRRKA